MSEFEKTVLAQLKAIQTTLGRLESEVSTARKDLGDIEHSVYGNGREGLLDRVKAIEATDKARKSSLATYLTIGGITLTSVFSLLAIIVSLM